MLWERILEVSMAHRVGSSCCRSRTCFSFLLGLLFLLLCGALQAQDASTGALRGSVVDATGGRIAGAKVTVTNSATGVARQGATNSEGRFSVELLPPGDYTIRVEAQGMAPLVRTSLHVDVVSWHGLVMDGAHWL